LFVVGAGDGYFRLMMGWNGQLGANNGMAAIDGNPAPNYETMVVAGVVHLNKGDYIEQFVYSCCDNR